MAKPNDIVLIYLEDAPVFFARVESILPDHKKGWFQIKLLMLQIPLQAVVWILKEEYINGEEFFMNQKKMRLEKVVCPVEDRSLAQIPRTNGKNQSEKTSPSQPDAPAKRPSRETGKVISFSDFQKKDG